MTQTTTTEYKHILVDEDNIPFIKGTSMKVVELITSIHAYGWSPEELHFQYPHLSMSQIYSSLAYYWEHKEEIDTDMQQRFEYAERLRLETGESPLAKRLRAEGLIK
ncbi:MULTISPECIES: DUF433 domain-containing protein [unclassified Nostoc]|uniref:DUF433 domain-containing protein n=1 Tax=unclassified Nostoc TaxID=2593658 RepID=UPI0026247E91|nr:DUF433 domain-containing protein [Nostoc sp. S13]MDF5739318.1 DUF433 domain-containing protein [Nostoc sp. S13]